MDRPPQAAEWRNCYMLAKCTARPQPPPLECVRHMPKQHLVKKGESAPGIAAAYGFVDWQTIYGDGSNADLRQKRQDPNVIFPGDIVNIPDIVPKPFTIATSQSHKFTVTRPKAALSFMVQDGAGEPIASKPFELRSPVL